MTSTINAINVDYFYSLLIMHHSEEWLCRIPH